MSEHEQRSPVSADEKLARFVTTDRWMRSDFTMRPNAFMPAGDMNLSVTRHLGLSQEGLWRIGQVIVNVVATKRTATLVGRADLAVADVWQHKLKVQEAPVPANPNHANITDWPSDKPAQKIIAQQLAAVARFTRNPPRVPSLEA